MNEGMRIARAIQKASRALRENARQTKQRKREITESEDLTTEAKAIALRKLREEGLARHQKLTAEIEKLQAKADRWIKHVHVTRPVEDTAVARIRKLLDDGHTAAAIIERAVEIGDTETLASLRSEMLWFGSRHGFADTTDTVAACDHALAQIGEGEDEREISRGLVQLREVAAPVAEIAEYSGKVALEQDTPHDLLKVAYATGSEADDA